MKKEVISGRVIYCFVANDLTADINYVAAGLAQGFKIAANALQNSDKVMNILSRVKKGSDIQLVINDGQLTEVRFLDLGVNLSLADYPMLGLSLKGSAAKKVVAKFERANVLKVGNKVYLQLCVRNAEKSIYQLEADKYQESRMLNFIKKCQKGDALKLSQNPEGEIYHIVNETQMVEFA